MDFNNAKRKGFTLFRSLITLGKWVMPTSEMFRSCNMTPERCDNLVVAVFYNEGGGFNPKQKENVACKKHLPKHASIHHYR